MRRSGGTQLVSATIFKRTVIETARALAVPCVTGLAFGHSATNLTWPFDGRATIDGERGEIRLLESGVEFSS